MSHSLDLPAMTVGSSPELLDPSVLDNELTPAAVVVAYHERTKHHYQRFAASLGQMAWAMRGEFETASPSEARDGALTRLHQGECRVLMVLENEKVLGLLTVGNIGELLALEAPGCQTGALAAKAGGGTGR